MLIREANRSDEHEVIEIMNQAIMDRKNAYLEIFNAENGRQWYDSLRAKAIKFCVCVIDNRIVGWGSLTSYRENRGALSGNVEITFYVHNDNKKQGIGTLIIKYLEEVALRLNKTHVVAILLDDNEASQILLTKKGYKTLGHFESIATFPNKTLGHLYMWKKLRGHES